MKKISPDANAMLQYFKDWKVQQENSKQLDFDYCKSVWNDLEKFMQPLDHISEMHVKFRTIVLNTSHLKKLLTEIHETIMHSMEGKLKTMFEEDLNGLSEELSTYYTTLNQDPATLNVYMDQLMAIKKIRANYSAIEDRLKNLKKLFSFGGS
jgi:DNA repair ATPase RecN